MTEADLAFILMAMMKARRHVEWAAQSDPFSPDAPHDLKRLDEAISILAPQVKPEQH